MITTTHINHHTQYLCSIDHILLAEIRDDGMLTIYGNCRHYRWKIMNLNKFFENDDYYRLVSQIYFFDNHKVYLLVSKQK
jgi:hypothetical protein